MTSLLDSRECLNCIHEDGCKITPDDFLWCFDNSKVPTYDGYLDYWWTLTNDDGTIIWGTIYNDSKGRYGDGVCVNTSPLITVCPREGCTVVTTDSVYKLGRRRKF